MGDLQPDLFGNSGEAAPIGAAQPLAARMRPRTLEEFVGQDEVLGPGKFLRKLLDASSAGKTSGGFPSLIFWGPPGSGKTTLARLIARCSDANFIDFSAVSSGVKEARQAIQDATDLWRREQRRTILFVDEIHRFNKAQQDAFLHAVEDGAVTLLGATTENPSFEVNNALLSRCRVITLASLSADDVAGLLSRALNDVDRGLGNRNLVWDADARMLLARLSGGDARAALTALEIAAQALPDGATILPAHVLEALQRRPISYDRDGEGHYNAISALHKSIRHSDPDAALYYLAIMMEGEEDPLFIARRLVRAASEDIGLADPQALVQALAAKDVVDFLGYPECDTALVQATVYLACAPKSNAVYLSAKEIRQEIRTHGVRDIPLHYRNAPTKLMKEIGYGEDYLYDHDWPNKISPQEAMPKGLENRVFYEPGELGFERELRKRLEYFRKIRAEVREKERE